MIDLDALDDELAPFSTHSEIRVSDGGRCLLIEFEVTKFLIWEDGTVCEGDGTEFGGVLAIIARHVEPRPADDLRASVIEEAQHLHKRFSPYLEDDNDWYRAGSPFDGKDAQWIAEFARDVLAVIGEAGAQGVGR